MNTGPTFVSVGVAGALASALELQGITRPFPIQALTITDALAGRDICGKAKTGSGKTLAFGLPMLERTPLSDSKRPASLVLVPTRELAIQVCDVLSPLGAAVDRRVAAIYGGADLDRQAKKLARGIDVVVATPGRLIDLVDRHAVSLKAISTLVLDEADRMADMGFMPQVEWLLRHMPNERQTLLFSATLDSAVDRLVRKYLSSPVFHEVHSEQVTVERMEHLFFKIHQLDKAKVAASIVRGSSRGTDAPKPRRTVLLFVRTKRGADRLAWELHDEGIKAAAIHGDMHQRDREKSLAAFVSRSLPALVATDVAARGLDVDNVDVVVHYDPPEDQKAYLHRSGRTDEAGEAGTVVSLLLWDQQLVAERLQRRLGLSVPIVEVFSNDPRFEDLSAFSNHTLTKDRSAERVVYAKEAGTQGARPIPPV